MWHMETPEIKFKMELEMRETWIYLILTRDR